MRDDYLTDDEVVEIAETYEETEKASEKSKKASNDSDHYLELVQKNGGDHKKAIFEYCYINNIPFSGDVYDTLVKSGDDEIFVKFPKLYVDTIKADFRFNDVTFFSQLKMENFEFIYQEDFLIAGLPEESRKDREQIIKIIGYDPFQEHPMEDKPQLYRDLTGMLTDSMRKDIPRAKAAVEVVTGYNNIRKYQNRANEIISSGQLDADSQKQLDRLLEMVAKIQKSVNDVSKENGFTNSRSLGSSGKGILSEVMNSIEEHSYDPGVPNYYDVATSKSIEQINDISVKSMLNQVKLTGQEYVEMLAEQNKIVRESQQKMRAMKEALRLAKEAIKKQELLDQLKEEYRKKGISEEDIDEFINREISMWDGR